MSAPSLDSVRRATTPEMLKVIESLLQEEREACANIAEQYGGAREYAPFTRDVCYAIAAKIRARP